VTTPLPAAFWHPDSGAVRLWVEVPGAAPIGAMLSLRLLQQRFDAKPDGSDAVASYAAHRAEIDAAVLARVRSGSIEPVMLREFDLPRPARR
jgi:hypothetical protein